MYGCCKYTTELYDSKAECIAELAKFLNELDKDVVDIEKTFLTNEQLAYYKPRLYLEAIIIYKTEEDIDL